eukprot:TRINITY_DN33222_c0_g1_i1.p1 TRINITY_DN33222_c0_g1~~TRINITY_DN33222_c0_g1_i1.p1  ORF type:complete len:560 (-),score=83.42 TRINITY_DN33222_c0_g1_i1:332-2011(-)
MPESNMAMSDRFQIFDPFPESREHLALVLVTHGLADIAMSYMAKQGVVLSLEDLALMPRPDVPALGSASLEKIVVRLRTDSGKALSERLARLQATPVVQAVLAFVTAANGLELQGGWQDCGSDRKEDAQGDAHAGYARGEEGIAADPNPEDRWAVLKRNYSTLPTGSLDQIAWLVGSSTKWPMAEELLRASGVESVKRFRSSCVVRSPKFGVRVDCLDVMKVVGGGALCAHSFGKDPRWRVDLKRYDVEIYGFLFHDSFACGILLGGQLRRNTNEDKYSYSSLPFGERGNRPYTVGDHQPWYMPRLRPSTSMLLLILSGLQPGETVLDPFGGCGTIAIEAAVHFERVHAISSDNNKLVSSAAIQNCILARPHLAAGSTLRAEDWDARNLKHVADASIDRMVTDMPFGNKCRWDVAVGLPAALGEIARVLRPRAKAVFLMKGYRRLEALVLGSQGTEEGIEDDVDPTNAEDDENEEDLLDGAETRNAEDADHPPADIPESVAEVSKQSGSSDVEQPVCLDGQFELCERRPVTVGGYLCYAIVLEKTDRVARKLSSNPSCK